ncbi:MAG: outer membrane beta-barrel protein, partial [Gemmatimonadota bacterium]
MRVTSSIGLVLAAVFGLTVAAGAQSGSGKGGGAGISITPYFGVSIPTSDLILRPSGGTSAGTLEKVNVSLALGGRLGLGLTEKVGLEGDVGYTSGNLRLTPLGSPVNTDVTTTTGSLRVAVVLVPRTAPLWLSVGGGFAAVHHSFDDRSGGVGKLQDKTDVGGVLGGSFG